MLEKNEVDIGIWFGRLSYKIISHFGLFKYLFHLVLEKKADIGIFIWSVVLQNTLPLCLGSYFFFRLMLEKSLKKSGYMDNWV